MKVHIHAVHCKKNLVRRYCNLKIFRTITAGGCPFDNEADVCMFCAASAASSMQGTGTNRIFTYLLKHRKLNARHYGLHLSTRTK